MSTPEREVVTAMSMEHAPERERLRMGGKMALSIRDFCSATGLCKTKVYEMLGSGELAAKRSNGRTLIPVDAAIKWFDALPDYTPREVCNP